MKKRYRSSGSSLFLLEIMVNILLFSILLCVCLQFFIKAHNLTNETTKLERAVSVCANVASLYEAGDGSLSTLDEAYPNSVILDERMILFLDDNFLSCSKENSSYSVIISYSNAVTALKGVHIACVEETNILYEIDAMHYEQHQISEGGRL